MQTILRPFPLQALHGRQLVALRDGTVLPARPIRPADAVALRRLHRRLSETSIYLRYFTLRPELSEQQARAFAAADGDDRLALVVEEPNAPAELIALAQWDRAPGTDAAELALLIVDDWQGRGLGTGLMRLLVASARERGLARLYGLLLPHNMGMRRVVQRMGLPTRMRLDDAQTVRIELDLAQLRPAA